MAESKNTEKGITAAGRLAGTNWGEKKNFAKYFQGTDMMERMKVDKCKPNGMAHFIQQQLRCVMW